MPIWRSIAICSTCTISLREPLRTRTARAVAEPNKPEVVVVVGWRWRTRGTRITGTPPRSDWARRVWNRGTCFRVHSNHPENNCSWGWACTEDQSVPFTEPSSMVCNNLTRSYLTRPSSCLKADEPPSRLLLFLIVIIHYATRKVVICENWWRNGSPKSPIIDKSSMFSTKLAELSMTDFDRWLQLVENEWGRFRTPTWERTGGPPRGKILTRNFSCSRLEWLRKLWNWSRCRKTIK